MSGAWYCTREDVKRSPDADTTNTADEQIDRLIESSSRRIDSLCHRKFHPFVGTRYFDFPSDRYGGSYCLRLEGNDLISVDSIVSGGVTIAPADYFLEPVNAGPPYTRIEIDLSSSASFNVGSTRQRNIAVTGVWGNREDEENFGTLTQDMTALQTGSSQTAYESNPEVGQIFRIGAEFFTIDDFSMADSTQNLQTSLTAQALNTVVAVSAGNGFSVGEEILIDGEKMLIREIAGNNLIVKRPWGGTVLAAHNSGADIYRNSNVNTSRARFGSVAAAHSSGSDLFLWKVPALVNQLAIAETVASFQQEKAAYAREIAAGDSVKEVAGRGLQDLRDDVYAAHGRKFRTRAV